MFGSNDHASRSGHPMSEAERAALTIALTDNDCPAFKAALDAMVVRHQALKGIVNALGVANSPRVYADDWSEFATANKGAIGLCLSTVHE